MISRFFKKKPKPAGPKKAAAEKASVQESPKEAPSKPKRLLTAEGWKRIMMRKTGKKK